MRLSRVLGHLGANGAIQAFNIATSLVIITLLPFDEIAAFAVVMLVAGPVGVLGTLRLEWILLNTPSATGTRMAAQAGLFMGVLSAPVALAVMAAFRAQEWFNFTLPDLTTLWLGALFCATFSAQRILVAFHLSRNPIRTNIRLRQLHAVARFGGSVVLCGAFGQAWAVFAAEILATVLFAALSGTQSVFGGIFALVRLRWSWLWHRHRRMLLSSTPSAVLSSVSANLVPVAMIALVGVEAGGVTYTVQRLAGIPVKFALSTVGEVWHKMVRRGDRQALWLAQSPGGLALGMGLCFVVMLTLIHGAAALALVVDRFLLESDKLQTVVAAVLAYQVFFAATLSANLFNRVLVMRAVMHLKLIFDLAYLLVPIGLLVAGPYWTPAPTVTEALFVLSLLQGAAYGLLAGLTVWIAHLWRQEARAQGAR